MTENHERRVGLNARSLDDFFRYAKLDGINLIEINPGAFDKNGSDRIWTYNDGIWKINRDVAKSIQDVAGENDIQVQIHIPYEETNDPTQERGLCQAVKEHHQTLLDRYKMLNDLFSEFSIGKVITTHPPSYLLNKGPVCSLAKALEVGRQFYFALDELIKEQGFGFKVGIENIADPKNHHAEAGYDIAHLKDLLGNTEEIGLTVDAGHRLLAKNMSVGKMFALAPIVNLHFHSNPGEFTPEDFRDDQHNFATKDNLQYFTTYIRSIRRYHIPVICETGTNFNASDQAIVKYISNLRTRLS